MADAAEPGITAGDVQKWLKLTEPDEFLAIAVAATNDLVSRLPVVSDLAAGTPWPASVKLGATMLAARLHRRRNSPNGVEAITESGTSYVSRYDPDVARLLGLESFAKPQIG